MTKIYANVKLVKNFRVDVDDGRAHTISLDLSPPDGQDMGPSALELAVMSYAGCYAAIFALAAKKARITIRDLEAHTEALKSEKVGTITEAIFNVNIQSDAPEDRIKHLHEVTLKTCPVGLLFEKAGVKVKSTVNIQR